MTKQIQVPAPQDIVFIAAQMFPNLSDAELLQFRIGLGSLEGPFYTARYIGLAAFNAFASTDQAVDLSIAVELTYPVLSVETVNGDE
jgi:hypothetical protein